MKILIVGAGAMGCLFAGYLLRQGHDVSILEINEERAATIRSGGLTIDDGTTSSVTACPHVYTSAAEAGSADCILIMVKAYDTGSAVQSVRPLVTGKTVVMTLQNGVGNVETIQQAVPHGRVLAGTTAQGATLLGPGHVRHAGAGETILGATSESGKKHVETLAAMLRDAGIATSVSDNITSLIWGKLLVNCGINPICALMDIKNGQLLESPHLVDVMVKVVREVESVAQACGVELPFADGRGKVGDVCRATSGNICSMLQDVRAGRKTEIAQMNGAVARFGAEREVPTPVNQTLADLVLAVGHMRRPG